MALIAASIRMFFRKARILLAAICLLLGGPPGAADEVDRARLAELSGSERLKLRAYGQALSGNALSHDLLAVMRHRMVQQGYYVDRGQAALVAQEAWVAPLLAWDGNINGGVLQDRFVWNGLVFEADQDYRAKAGIVAGASAGAILRYGWDTGRIIELQGGADLGWSPAHDIGRADLMLSVCSQNHLAGWSFLDLCAANHRSWRQLGSASAGQVSAVYSRIIPASQSLHELGFGYIRAFADEAPQNRMLLSAESVWNRTLTKLTITLGQAIDDTTALRHRIEAKVGWIGANRGWVLDIWSQQAEGGLFLGAERRDHAQGIGLTTDLPSDASIRLGYLNSKSSAGIANYEQVTLDIRFGQFSW
jgi:hypothetical protein